MSVAKWIYTHVAVRTFETILRIIVIARKGCRFSLALKLSLLSANLPVSIHVTHRVSSVLNRDVKQFGKKYMFDTNEETCWNSDQVILADNIAFVMVHSANCTVTAW